ncbi:MAG TPA: flagellar export chaperone FliS [Acidimicrobiales bacterium]|nr:flagellar export chaperone FliS [Acidimicrobiales bacterium]
MTTTAERAEALRRRYLADQVETASPEQRLLMLLARLGHDLRMADEGFGVGDLKVVNDGLVHAQQIVLVLRDSLDDEWTGAASLRTVYTFVHQRLVTANLQKDRALLPACVNIVGRITEANAAAAAALAGTVPVG